MTSWTSPLTTEHPRVTQNNQILGEISIVKNINESSKITQNIPVMDFLNMIKETHPQKERIILARADGKYNTNKIFKVKNSVKQKDGTYKVHFSDENLYNLVKKTEVICFTPNATFNERRRLDNFKKFSGIIYFDIDSFDKFVEATGCKPEEAKELVKKKIIGWDAVLACWDSFGQQGIGCAIIVKNLTVENFKNTWVHYAQKLADWNIEVDKATKDITRPNVLSYDPHIFIRDLENVWAANAVNTVTTKQTVVKAPEIETTEQEQLILESIFERNYSENYSAAQKRMHYQFYFLMAAQANNAGVELESVVAFLLGKAQEDKAIFAGEWDVHTVEHDIFEKVYSTYEDKKGEMLVFESNSDLILLHKDKPFVSELVNIRVEDIFAMCNMQKYKDAKEYYIALIKKFKTGGIGINAARKELIDKLGYDTLLSKVITDIYQDKKVNFGVSFKLKKEAIELKRTEYIKSEIESGNEVIIYEEENYGDDNVEQIYQKHIGSLSKTPFLCIKNFYLDMYAHNYNQDYIETYIIDFFNHVNIKSYVKYLNLMIKGGFYDYKKGVVVIKNQLTKKVQKVQKNTSDNSLREYTKVLKLPNHQKISDLNLNFDVRTYLVGKPNMGKTFWVCKAVKGLRLLIVPTTAALLDVKAKYKVPIHYENEKGFKAKSDINATTYDSFDSVCSLLAQNNISLKDVTLYFDEAHYLATAGAKNYKNKALNSVVDKFKLFKNVVFMSGTPFETAIPEMQQLEYVKIEWEIPVITKAQIIRFDDQYPALYKRCSNVGKNVIYLQNKKEHGQLGNLKNFLKESGVKENEIQVINSNEKNSSEFKDVLNTEYIKPHVRFIICTSLIAEAINIQNIDVETIHFLTVEHPIICEQMVNRFRKRVPYAYIYNNKFKPENDNKFPLTSDEVQKDLILNTQQALPFLQNNLKYEAIFDISKNRHTKYVSTTNSLELDYISIANCAYENEKNYLISAEKAFKNKMVEYDWVFDDDDYEKDKMDTAMKTTLKGLKEEAKEEFYSAMDEILDEIAIEGEEKTQQIVAEKDKNLFVESKYPYEESDLRFKTVLFSKLVGFDKSTEVIKHALANGSYNEKTFNKYRSQLIHKKVAVEVENSTFENNLFDKKIMDWYVKASIGRSALYTNNELRTLVQKTAKTTKMNLHVLVEGFDHIEFLNKYFTVKYSSQSLQGTDKYYVGGVVQKNDYVIFKRAFDKIMKNYHETESRFTGQQLANQLNVIFQETVSLRGEKYKASNAIELLSNFATIKKKTVKNVGDFYTIIDLFPKETKDFEILVPTLETKIYSEKLNDNDTLKQEDLTISNLLFA